MTRESEKRRAASANRNVTTSPHGELATAVLETMDRAHALSRTLGPVAHGQAEVRKIWSRIEKARAELKTIDNNLEDACDAALAEFYLDAAERLMRPRSRASLVRALEGRGSRARIPKLFDTVLKRIGASGYEADLDDLQTPLNTAGEQLIALVLAGGNWPVLLAGDSEAPIIGKSIDGSDRSTLQRMRAEERQISADGGVTELRNPNRAIAGLMTSLASWLPFRIVPKSESGGGSGGRGAQGDGGHNRGSSRPPGGPGRSPNFRVHTLDPECAISSRIAFLGQFVTFGGPCTPVDSYLNRGFYFFKAYYKDRTYTTPDKVKVPDNSPLTIPFPSEGAP